VRLALPRDAVVADLCAAVTATLSASAFAMAPSVRWLCATVFEHWFDKVGCCHRCRVCIKTGLTPITSAPRPGSLLPRLHRDLTRYSYSPRIFGP
jgi:hypothetical protein